jgi:hypothetical protein
VSSMTRTGSNRSAGTRDDCAARRPRDTPPSTAKEDRRDLRKRKEDTPRQDRAEPVAPPTRSSPRRGLNPKAPPCTSKENVIAIASEGRHGRASDLATSVEGGSETAQRPLCARMRRAGRSWPSCGSTRPSRPTSSLLFPLRAEPGAPASSRHSRTS